MGSIRNVACPCGFKAPVTVGGSMRHFHEDSRFPFYCETCGIVDVNVAKDDLYCPKWFDTPILPIQTAHFHYKYLSHNWIFARDSRQ